MSELKANQPTHKVTVQLAHVMNLGNYETLRIDVSVEDQAKPGENADATFNRVYDFVESKLAEKIKEEKAAGK